LLGISVTLLLFVNVLHAAYLGIVASIEGRQTRDEQVLLNPPLSETQHKQLKHAVHNLVNACTVFVQKLPTDYVLYAGGSHQGHELNYSIDQSGDVATEFTVKINIPNQPVVLALGAYDASVWRIYKTANTDLVGVLVSGYESQKVIGLDPKIPLLTATYEEKSPCGYFYIGDGRILDQADKTLNAILGKSPQLYYQAADGQIVFGEPFEISEFPSSREIIGEVNAPLAGQLGINALIEAGALRPATVRDLNDYYEATGLVNTKKRINGLVSKTSVDLIKSYVVLKSITIPAGLFGKNAVIFIVAKGVLYPLGNPGHSTIYDMNSLSCAGVWCER